MTVARIILSRLPGRREKILATAIWMIFVQKGDFLVRCAISMKNILTAPSDASWANIGPVKGGSEEYCAAGSQYFGPCSDEIVSFGGMSTNAKRRWSKNCEVRLCWTAAGVSAERPYMV